MAFLGNRDDATHPSRRAIFLKRNFSPSPRGNVKFTYIIDNSTNIHRMLLCN